ncbi:MAG: phosphatidylglycerophosphatase A [Proteobacteria bacterium]|nr:phosphatidylglycerophosphatase A [Pseudomonadota bacterium]
MKPGVREVMTQPVHLLAFGFGAGLSPLAPGTIGTLVAVPLAAAAWLMPLWPRVALGIVLLVGGTWICGESARRLGVHDYGGIVMDEIASFYLLMLLLPANWSWMAAGFVMFRIFDIAKPWPIGPLDRRVGGGFGIMLDDVVAALFAALVLQLGNLAWKSLA